MSLMGWVWHNTNRSLGARRAGETGGQEMPESGIGLGGASLRTAIADDGKPKWNRFKS
jgi:hypothetical protein